MFIINLSVLELESNVSFSVFIFTLTLLPLFS
ncbi:hypothetical protein Alsa3_CDS0123 [Staphylococcus phage Alsa_3]|nr:hypothetical protein Alsa3_CDS0123 [Staphylococcus phage Alsa_3]WNM51249.1 hypothetical protein Alsa4_CDS0119 [Staphylococcus phage Alsa_4]WNM56154.1 hypothetical protein CoNPh38_CDS0278 [Staphylococcus phage S-CoN_Ph38]